MGKGKKMDLKKRIKKIGKYVCGILGAAVLISQAVLPSFGATANSPRFNFLEGDYELLRGANKTQNETVWKDPVSANAGDVVSAIVYYHNGMVNTTAENTRVKVNIPSESTGKTAKITASISADNAETINDTVINGQIVGVNGLTINLDEDANLSLVPGSVKLFPDMWNNGGEVPLPFNQNGAEILTASGLNIGAIQGCWQYSGFVTFRIQTSKKPVPVPADLKLEKTVKNISKNETNFAELTYADQAEKVTFRLAITAQSQIVNNVFVSDLLPADLSYIPGTLTLIKKGIASPIDAGQFFANGANIGEIAPEYPITYITFQATAPAEIYETKNIVNTAEVTAGSLTKSDPATVVLRAGNISIIKEKSAFNVTQGKNAPDVSAKSGDIIDYTLKTKNSGTLPAKITVEDGIADVLEYADVVLISDGGSVVNGPVNTNEEKVVRYPEVSIPAGDEIVRKFSVKVKNTLPENVQNGYHFDLKMYNHYGNDVLICIFKPTPEPTLYPNIMIDKTVRNQTLNEINFVNADSAYAGDTIEYKIWFKNVGQGKAVNLKIYDVLPPNVSLLGTSIVLSLDGVEQTIPANIVSGYVISELASGKEGYMRFSAKIADGISANEHLKNVAFASYSDKSISDDAETVISEKITLIKTIEKVVEKPVTREVIIQSEGGKGLPKTGAATIAFSGLLSAFGAINYLYFRNRKKLSQLMK